MDKCQGVLPFRALSAQHGGRLAAVQGAGKEHGQV